MTSVDVTIVSKTYCHSKEELTIAEVQHMLTNVDVNLVSKRPVQKPCGGDVYVYQYQPASITKGMENNLTNKNV